MSEERTKTGRDAGAREVSVRIPEALARQLDEFCRELKVARDKVVERALIEYFREGDMSH